MRQFLALSLGFCLTILLSSCAWYANTPSDRAIRAAKKAPVEKSTDKKASEAEKEMRDKKKKEKEEHKNFALIKSELKKDNAKATTYPGRSAYVPKLLFAEEILVGNEHLQTISTCVEDLLARVQTLPSM